MKKDWIECKFDDVFFTTSGGTPSRRNENYYIGNIPWIKSGELKSNVITEAEEFISEEAVKNSSAKVFPAGTILLALYGATIGKIAILGIPAATNQAICGIFETPFVFSKYAYYYLVNKKSYLIKQGIGGAQPNISQTILKNLDFSLPPLPEQRAIVKKLESLFSSLDAGVTDLKKAQQQLKIYRQAVLKKAFEGELTNIKIENLVTIGQNVIVNPRPPKEGFDDDIECQFVPMKLVEALSNKIHLEETAVFNTLKGKSYTYFETGDVIFAKVTPCMENGKIAVAKDLKNGIALGSSEFHVFRCNEDLLNEYLFYYIVQNKFRSDAERAMTGAVGLRRVPKKFIEDYLIPLPIFKEQKEIVKQIESRLSVCDSIEQNIKESLEKAEALRQSILKKAFEGNLLTAQELAECKQATDYEPASVLLGRIKAEQGNAISQLKNKVIN